MARFIVWSDLHQEFRNFEVPARDSFPGPVDGILIAGDTDTHMAHLEFAERVATLYECPVVLVDGNHEYYHSEISDFDLRETAALSEIQARGVPVHLLRGGAVTIAGARIAGATLWTDFALNPLRVQDAMDRAETVMADYRCIKIDDGGIRPIRASDILARHRLEKEMLWRTLQTPFEGPTVVMTHHMPIAQAIHPKYASHPLVNASFANDFETDIARFRFDAWICGHSHDIPSVEIKSLDGPRNIVANPRGYPNEVNTFDPLFTLEV